MSQQQPHRIDNFQALLAEQLASEHEDRVARAKQSKKVSNQRFERSRTEEQKEELQKRRHTANANHRLLTKMSVSHNDPDLDIEHVAMQTLLKNNTDRKKRHEQLVKSSARNDEQDDKDREALMKLVEIRRNKVVRVATPAPVPGIDTPGSDRKILSRKRDVSPSHLSRRVLFRTEGGTKLVPVDETLVNEHQTPWKTRAGDNVVGKKITGLGMGLFVVSGAPNISAGNVDYFDGFPGDTRCMAQIQDCTCVLTHNGNVVPVVFFKKTSGMMASIGLGKARLVATKTDLAPLDVNDDRIIEIQAVGSTLLAIGESKLHLLEYNKNMGTFQAPVSFPMDVIAGGGVALLSNHTIIGFGDDIHGKKTHGALRMAELDKLASTDNVVGEVNWDFVLHKKRDDAKIASGSTSPLILGFDTKKTGERSGKLYVHKGDKLHMVGLPHSLSV